MSLNTLTNSSVTFLTGCYFLNKDPVTYSYFCIFSLKKLSQMLQFTQALHRQTYDYSEYHYRQCVCKSVILPSPDKHHCPTLLCSWLYKNTRSCFIIIFYKKKVWNSKSENRSGFVCIKISYFIPLTTITLWLFMISSLPRIIFNCLLITEWSLTYYLKNWKTKIVPSFWKINKSCIEISAPSSLPPN